MEELMIEAVLVHSRRDIEFFYVRVPEEKSILIRAKLEFERKKIVNILKNFKLKGIITSIHHPKNLVYKKELHQLVCAKRLIDKSLNTLKHYYT